MESDNTQRGQKMREYKALWSHLRTGMSVSEVRGLLGEPTATMKRDEIETPSDFFRAIGSMFRFPDEDADLVWAYVDPYRPRVTNFIGFSNDKVQATWRDTLTPARWSELKGSDTPPDRGSA